MSTPVLLPVSITHGYFDLIVHTESNPQSACWCGRVWTLFADGVVDIAKGVADGACKVIRVFGQLRTDAATFGRVIRLGVNAFSVIETAFGRPGLFAAVANRLKTTDSMIDTFQVFDQVSYFGQGKCKNDTISSIIANTAFLAAGVGGVVLLLGEVSLLALSKLSVALGSIPVFGIVFNLTVGLGDVLNGFVIVGFSGLGADAIKRLMDKEKSREEKIKAGLDLAWHISEIALKVFALTASVVALAGVAIHPVALGVGMLTLGTVAAGLGIISYLYGVSQKEKQEKQKLQICPSGTYVI